MKASDTGTEGEVTAPHGGTGRIGRRVTVLGLYRLDAYGGTLCVAADCEADEGDEADEGW